MRLDDGTRTWGRLVIGKVEPRRERESRAEPSMMIANDVRDDGNTVLLWRAGGWKFAVGSRARFVGVKGWGMPPARPLRSRCRLLMWRLRGSPKVRPSTPDVLCEDRQL